MIKIQDRVYLVSNLFLGDAFVINALVHKFAQECNQLHVPTLPQYVTTVSSLYADHPHIHVVPYLGAAQEQAYIQDHALQVINFRTLFEVTKLPMKHHDAPVQVPVNWDRQIYEYFDVPFSRRYKDFRLPKHIPGSQELLHKLNPEGEPYVVWHRHSHQNLAPYDIDLAAWRQHVGAPDRKIIEVQTGHTANLLAWMDVLRHAEEIHVVPSAVHCLVDSVLDQISASLFYHDVKVTTLMQVNSRWNAWRWHTIYYDNKI